MKRILRRLCVAVLLLAGGAAAHGQSAYEFDATKSKLEIDVYKDGFFRAFGHDHLVAAKEFSGRLLFDPDKIENSSVTLRVAAKSLTVTDPRASEKERHQVQASMQGEKVLDVARHPEIAFTSTGVTMAKKKGGAWSATLAGTLQLHGRGKSVSLPVTVRVSGGELTAQGEVFLLQTDYGITPIKAGGGTVKVKDRLRIRFEFHAHPAAKF